MSHGDSVCWKYSEKESIFQYRDMEDMDAVKESGAKNIEEKMWRNEM